MTSNAKRRANKRNSTNGGGPKTEAGKRRVRLNALKEGLFAHELIVKENEKPEYAALQTALGKQYAPSTAMQQIGFERILCCAWRVKLSLRMEMRRLNAHLDLQTQQDPLAEGVEEKAEAPRWYGFGRAELRAATRMLLALRADIQANGWIHREQWKESLDKTFGSELYDLLTNWSPASIDDILMAEHLVAHAKTFGKPLPELDPGKGDPAIGDPRSRWEMMVKLVDLKLQQLNDFRLLLEGGAEGDSLSAASLDVGSRYFTSASRDLERAVAWYEYIKQLGL
jgi:hypothetical protein